jgi:hypothetical protein
MEVRMSRVPLVLAVLILPVAFVGVGASVGAQEQGEERLKLLRPADKAEMSFHRPGAAVFSLGWQPFAGATGYRIVLAQTPDLGRPLVDRKLAATWVELRGLNPGQYYWRVEAHLTQGGPVASKTASFTVKPAEDEPAQ